MYRTVIPVFTLVAEDGAPLGILEDGQLSAGVSSSLAAWNGRLFVVVPAPLESTATARVLCYGP